MSVAPALSFNQAARCLAELGHPHRLEAFRLLVRAGEAGLSVGEIGRHLDLPKSTLAHHIAQLVAAGIITQTREGRVQRCRVEPQRTRAFLHTLSECCEGLSELSETRGHDR